MSRQTTSMRNWVLWRGFSIDIRLLSLNAFNFNRKRIAYRIWSCIIHSHFSVWISLGARERISEANNISYAKTCRVFLIYLDWALSMMFYIIAGTRPMQTNSASVLAVNFLWILINRTQWLVEHIRARTHTCTQCQMSDITEMHTKH